MNIATSLDAKKKLDLYSAKERVSLLALRKLILDVAKEIQVENLEETLKWGELSYLTKNGSTIRIDTRGEKKSGDYAVYFKCTSKLVPTFKTIYPDLFTYEGNRAIVFGFDEKIPKKQLRKCIEMALVYHTIKDSLMK